MNSEDIWNTGVPEMKKQFLISGDSFPMKLIIVKKYFCILNLNLDNSKRLCSERTKEFF